jgi:serine/threonine-protein kinase
VSDELSGRLLGARFRLEQKLGAGGMGAVYAALDELKHELVAIKIIRESLSENPEAIQRFEREVRATAALRHPNIVRFLDAGQEGGLRWLAMELLHGSTLKDRIRSQNAIAWRDTLPILHGIVLALRAAHAAGLIHRDLKPENVFLADEPDGSVRVKLLDFGVAKHTTLEEGMTMTGTGIVVGTPGFVAPEVVLHGVADDPRSDFYGLGATWFEMLTGSKPFSAATPFALAMRHLNEKPPRPTDLLPFSPIPAPVEDLLLRLLEKTPNARPKDADELLAALAHLQMAAGQSHVLTDRDVSSEAVRGGAITGDELCRLRPDRTEALEYVGSALVLRTPWPVGTRPNDREVTPC